MNCPIRNTAAMLLDILLPILLSFFKPLSISSISSLVTSIGSIDSVATALLAILLLTCFLIFALSILSTYLFLKLRASRAEKGLDLCAQPTTQLPEPTPTIPAFTSVWPSSFSDASNPDWENDVHYAMDNLSAWPVTEQGNKMYTCSKDQMRAERILDELGYQGIPIPTILGFLRRQSTRKPALKNIVITVALARTSFESEPPFTLFPFPPEVYNDIRNCFRALEGTRRELSRYYTKVIANFYQYILKFLPFSQRSRVKLLQNTRE